MEALLLSWFGDDLYQALLTIANLVIIESLLSVDNAAVLATMVMRLPLEQRDSALKLGILGAYLFRGLCLVFAFVLINFSWLKLLGGAYLLWIGFKHFWGSSKQCADGAEHTISESFTSRIERMLSGLIGKFWTTVLFVEIMDLAFSIDNVFAAVALTDRIGLICLGVFIGILTMRFVAQAFVGLMERYSFLENSAYLVILLLGLKLVLSYACGNFPTTAVCQFVEGHQFDTVVSIGTVGIFVMPIIWQKLQSHKKCSESKEDKTQ